MRFIMNCMSWIAVHEMFEANREHSVSRPQSHNNLLLTVPSSSFTFDGIWFWIFVQNVETGKYMCYIVADFEPSPKINLLTQHEEERLFLQKDWVEWGEGRLDRPGRLIQFLKMFISEFSFLHTSFRISMQCGQFCQISVKIYEKNHYVYSIINSSFLLSDCLYNLINSWYLSMVHWCFSGIWKLKKGVQDLDNSSLL